MSQHSILISSGREHLNMKASAWEVLWITLKLAKVFPHDVCLQMMSSGGKLSVLDLQKIRFHIKHILFASMERGDYLMPDLTLSDLHPLEAFAEGDSRREQFLDRQSLDHFILLISDARREVSVRWLTWDLSRFDHSN
jgi:hypothetical protein